MGRGIPRGERVARRRRRRWRCCVMLLFPPGLLRVLDLRVGRGRGRRGSGVSSAASSSSSAVSSSSSSSAAAPSERRRLGRDRKARRELDELFLGVAGVGVSPDVADVFLVAFEVCLFVCVCVCVWKGGKSE